ncbi:unnamed protein product, partial [marine sediment metagenome]
SPLPPNETCVINEVEANPPGNDANTGVYEWVELYNSSNQTVEIGGWQLSTTAGNIATIMIPQGTVIGPGQVHIVERGAQWIDNMGEMIVLRDASGNQVDASCTINDEDNDDRSWQRDPNGLDTDSPSDWTFKSSSKDDIN